MDEHTTGAPAGPDEDELARESHSQKMPWHFLLPTVEELYGPHSGSLRVEKIKNPKLIGDGTGKPVERFMPKPVEGTQKNVPLENDPRD